MKIRIIKEKQRNIKVREIKNTLENNINPGLSGNTDEIVDTLIFQLKFQMKK